jgi:hypothetical protein
MRTALGTLIAGLLVAQTAAQTDPGPGAASISGTWSSGAKNVLTGPGFCNPVTSTFTYPATAGISYSFTQDGYFEEALYRFTGNGTDPRCIIGLVQWQHGDYELLANGSIVLEPFASDGRQQVQDACAADSNVLRQFNQTTLFLSWQTYTDPQGNDRLQLYRFDGAPFAPMFRVSSTPTMLPTQPLTNTSIGVTAQRKRSITGPWSLEQQPQKRSAAQTSTTLALTAFYTMGLLSVGLLAAF